MYVGEHSIQKKQVEMHRGDSMETSENLEALWCDWQMECSRPGIKSNGHQTMKAIVSHVSIHDFLLKAIRSRKDYQQGSSIIWEGAPVENRPEREWTALRDHFGRYGGYLNER